MDPRQKFNEITAGKIIEAFEKRNMEAYYCDNKADAKEKILDLISQNSTIAWGGSVTLKEIGILESLDADSHTLLDRSKATTSDEITSIYQKAFSADYYLMSSNAITLDGKLVNIDGNGNRVAALIYGPKEVIIVAGMNKIVLDETAALKRIHNEASPLNTIRLDKKTPCAATGACHDCLCPDTICCQTVITRYSRTPGRIKVILVGEILGY